MLDLDSLRDRLPERKKWFQRLRDRPDLKELGMGENAFQEKELEELALDLNPNESSFTSRIK
jgi:hypothetical protein